MNRPLTDDELRGIELDHEAVRMARGWDLEEGWNTRKEGDRLVLFRLPDDLQRCVDAVPRLLARLEQSERSREVSELGTEYVKLKAIGAAREHVTAADATHNDAAKAYHDTYASALMAFVKLIESAHDAPLVALDKARGGK